MKLYHGTSERHLAAILDQGIKPRGRRAGNWKHSVPSLSSAVYLTDAYAIYYARVITRGTNRLAVIEIDSDKLQPWRMRPDEDFLAHAYTKVLDNDGTPLDPPADLFERVTWFRKRLHKFAGEWEHSLKGLGNCCYEGSIPASAITRYALVPRESRLSLVADPTISLINYAIMGNFYRALTAHAFGDPLDAATPDLGGAERVPTFKRDGVEVHSMKEPVT